MLGVVTALPLERGWLGVVDARRGPAVVVCGAGSRRARHAAQRLLAEGATALASWGSAAGLDAAVGAGTVVVPRRVLAAAGESYEVDPSWHGRLLEVLGARVRVSSDSLVDAPHLLESVAAKSALRERSGAAAADMESATVAAAAAAAGVPFLAVRVVLDDAGSPLPRTVVRALDGAGRLRTAGLWSGVLARPQDWRLLLELARSYRAARRAMVEVWRLAAPDLALEGTGGAATDARG